MIWVGKERFANCESNLGGRLVAKLSCKWADL